MPRQLAAAALAAAIKAFDIHASLHANLQSPFPPYRETHANIYFHMQSHDSSHIVFIAFDKSSWNLQGCKIVLLGV